MKKRNFFVSKKGRLNPFADEDGYTDGLGDAPEGEIIIIEDFLPPPEYFRQNFGFRIISDEDVAAEEAKWAREAEAKRKAARELPAMPALDRPYPKPQYAHGEAMMLRDSAASDPA